MEDPNSIQIDILGKKLTITGEKGIDLTIVYKAKPFVDWISEFQYNNLELKGIHVQSLDMFGNRVGFIKFKAEVTRDGKYIPSIVFMRGGSVGILPIIKHNNIDYVLTTVQVRTPLGRLFIEIPAGMLDDNGDFKGQAATEMEEETGLKINKENLIDLIQLTYGNKYKGMIPSGGGCDEFIRLYVYKEIIEDETKFNELQGKCTGQIEKGEVITLNLIKLEDLWKITSDAKALSALLLYEKLIATGKISS